MDEINCILCLNKASKQRRLPTLNFRYPWFLFSGEIKLKPGDIQKEKGPPQRYQPCITASMQHAIC